MQLKTLQNGFFIVLIVLTTVAFLWLIQDFAQPVFWAAVLAIIFYPVQTRWLDAVGQRRSLASVLTLLTILIAVILPLTLIGAAVTQEAVQLYDRIASGEVNLQQYVQRVEELVPVVTDLMNQFGVDFEKLRQGLSDAAVTVSQFLASQALAIGQNTLRIGALFFVMLYILFFFLRDGQRFLDLLIRAMPLGDAREQRLMDKFAEVSRATIKGTLVVGVVQGSLGGLLFWMLGIDSPVFWGVLMTVLSLLPAIGSALIWGPAALILLATGSIAKGIILIAAGTLIIGLVDNVLRPILVGRDTKMPDFLILITTLGGLTLFGISGFVIGPIIAALFLAVWEMFIEEYGEADDVLRPATAAPTSTPPEPPSPPAADGTAPPKTDVEGA
ncbi:MAG: AI-2E family transporter [Bacteroidetes bacterium]|jgi:predicted PurR-regulated permease PerM|nr:AI-2E family transporter [Bacteroidota bacterium]